MAESEKPKLLLTPKNDSTESCKEEFSGECQSLCGRTDFPYDQDKVEHLKQEWQLYLSKIKESEANNQK